ncbi:MAG TPA: hypothetical protein VIV11_28195 [Kofleriaceae bacterium]
MHRKLVCLAIAVSTSTSHAEPAARDNQLRADLAFSGPGGIMAVRYSRVLPSGTRIEPAFGLAYTGVIGSVLVTQPFTSWDRRTQAGTLITTTLEVYGGYGASWMGGRRHPWAGRESFIDDGVYHWADFGLSMQGSIRDWLITAGSGASVLVSAPMSFGEDREDDHLWFLFPEGWMAKQRWVPTLWTSIGYAF